MLETNYKGIDGCYWRVSADAYYHWLKPRFDWLESDMRIDGIPVIIDGSMTNEKVRFISKSFVSQINLADYADQIMQEAGA